MLAGLGFGLALSPYWSPPGGSIHSCLTLILILVVVVERGRVSTPAAVLVFLAALLAGSAVGGERLEMIDGGAFSAKDGSSVTVEGVINGPVRPSNGITRIPVETGEGRLLVETAAPPEETGTGQGIRATGEVGWPAEWYRADLKRRGISMVLDADEVVTTGVRRGGLMGIIDRLRNRASEALGRMMPEREAALARGFVLGQEEGIDERTKEDFQASSLAHLLAVSGQNVVLLGLLAIPFMAMAGLGPRQRLLTVAVLILIYVPLTGAGASIQRAGIMGLAGLAAIAASRPGSRLYAILLAAVLTLALNPRVPGDIGWQLSFAAVIGIFLLVAPLQERLKVLTGEGAIRSALVSGMAVTVAATLATAPLMAFHFERVSLTSLVANLAVMPAVAPAMWLGMVSAAVGQIAGPLAVPFNLLNSLFLAYIAQVAAWFGGPAWSEMDVEPGGPLTIAFVYLLITFVCVVALRRFTPSRLGRDRPPDVLGESRRKAVLVLAIAAACMLLLLPDLIDGGRRQLGPPPPGGARVEILDVGQGDAILIRPDGQDPVLIDGGPPGGDLEGALDSAGVDRLAAVILTHGDLDHAGGLPEVFGRVEVEKFLFDGVPRELLSQARTAGAEPARISEGQVVELGPARMEVLWPPTRMAGSPPSADPNSRSVTIELSVADFRMLLTGDGEAEVVPVRPGPVDVLKVAHHGSDDAGLPLLLESTSPELAVISSGEDNPFGHPTEATLAAISSAGLPVERTDTDGTISIVIAREGWSVESGR